MVDFIGKDRESGISKGNDSYIVLFFCELLDFT
jgi:hypothetical protein